MTTHIIERKTTERDAWYLLASQCPNVIDVTASDYDEGGNNSVTVSIPCRRGTTPAAEMEKDIASALDMAREHLLSYLGQQRKKETAGDKIIRFLRREWRYLLSRTKVNN